MHKKLIAPLKYDKEFKFQKNEIEIALPISQDQLNGAKLFNSKYEYVKTLNKNISYLEVGVAWGYSAQMIIDTTNAKSADLLDLYNNAAGTAQPGGSAPENMLITHEQYIKNKFAYHPNINVIKGDAKDVLFTLNKAYDFILLDMETERFLIRKFLLHCSKLVNVNGVIGLTDYTNYDSILYDQAIGVYQSVNEFLYYNKNWSVDAIVLNDIALHDIYIKRNS